MKRQELSQRLRQNYQAFLDDFRSMSDEDFRFQPPGKWTTGQHLDHLWRSVRPLNLAFGLPPFVLRWLFGAPRRKGQSYEYLVAGYHAVLDRGGKAKGRYIPKAIEPSQKQERMAALEKAVDKLAGQINRFSEEQLDRLRLPHPLLGMLSLREMLYFTIYHVEHHRRLVISP